MRRIKRFLVVLIGLVGGIAAAIMLLTSDFSHIEDTNGPDVYTLQTITDENIINRDLGAMGLEKSTSKLSNRITYSSDCFSGVDELHMAQYFASSMVITVHDPRVTAGNLRLVVLVDDEIVHDFPLNEGDQTCELQVTSGTVAIRLAGESAEFSLSIDIY